MINYPESISIPDFFIEYSAQPFKSIDTSESAICALIFFEETKSLKVFESIFEDLKGFNYILMGKRGKFEIIKSSFTRIQDELLLGILYLI